MIAARTVPVATRIKANIMALLGLIFPDGMARFLVRIIAESISLSRKLAAALEPITPRIMAAEIIIIFLVSNP